MKRGVFLDYKSAKKLVYRLIKYRWHSEEEVRNKLYLKNYPENVIVESIGYFKKVDLINDKRFVEGWIKSRLTKLYGINRIRHELKIKGINHKIIDQSINRHLNQYDELKAISKILEKRVSKYKLINTNNIKTKEYNYLIQRGFNEESINSALVKFLD